MIEIVETEIDTQYLIEYTRSPTCGASVLFIGSTRRFTASRETTELEYECYRSMAAKKLDQLRRRALDQWPIERCAIVHRIGTVPIGEASVAVAVSSPHRRDAFEAAQWLIDTLKQEVPIWKKELWADGSQEWIHPDARSGLDAEPGQGSRPEPQSPGSRGE